MPGLAAGSGFGPDVGGSIAAGPATGTGAQRWPPPAWKFGVRASDDRGGI